MSLVFCDGVDDGLGALGKWDLSYVVYGVDNSGRNTKCYRIGPYSSAMLHKSLGTDEYDKVTVGLALLAEDSNVFRDDDQNLGLIEFRSDAGATLHVRVVLVAGATPTIKVYRGAGTGSLLASVTVPAWIVSQWYYLEAQAILSDTVGAVTVKLNGTTYVNVTGVDTKNGGTKTVFDSFAIRDPGNGWMRVDDIYATNGSGGTNNGFLGDVAVETIYPNGDGSSSDWVGSDSDSVNNSLLVDESSLDTTDYVQSATSGSKDLYAYSNLSRSSGTVFGIVVTSYAKKSDGGAISLKNAIKSGATALSSAAKSLVTTYLPVSSVFETDPNASAAWTVATVNSVEAGVEVA